MPGPFLFVAAGRRPSLSLVPLTLYAMQSGWRFYAVMIALAALTGTVVALALSGGPRFPSEGPRRSAGATATASASASAGRLPSSQTSPSPTPSPTPTPSATPSDPLLRIRPLVFAWRPSETTAIVEKLTESGTRLIAVPLTGAPATPLLDLPTGTQWSLRLDGSAIALTLTVETGSAARTRVAALNLQTGAVGWATPDEPTVSHTTPWWSNDGSVVYYTRTSLDGGTDEGIYRVRVDGTNLTQLRAPSSDGAIRIAGLTPDGLGLVLSRAVVSGYVDILDLNTRVIRSLQSPATLTGSRSSAFVQAWRSQRPRALVSFGGPAGGPQLYVWDDAAPPATLAPIVRDGTVAGADWDPTGTRIVAALSLANSPSQLFLIDVNGQNRTAVTGATGASNPYWLRAGIVYLYATSLARPTEVRLAPATGTTPPKTLYSGTDLIRLVYVSP